MVKVVGVRLKVDTEQYLLSLNSTMNIGLFGAYLRNNSEFL